MISGHLYLIEMLLSDTKWRPRLRRIDEAYHEAGFYQELFAVVAKCMQRSGNNAMTRTDSSVTPMG